MRKTVKNVGGGVLTLGKSQKNKPLWPFNINPQESFTAEAKEQPRVVVKTQETILRTGRTLTNA